MSKKLLCFFCLGLVIFSGYSAPRVTSEEAMERLKEGNRRYVENDWTSPRRGAEARADTAKGQYPFGTILTCSDSRVPPEIIFDQGIGDIFVIRIAGNIADTDGAGSIEYSTEHLGTNLIVVLGHTHCGAVSAAVSEAVLDGNIISIVDKIMPAAAQARKDFPTAGEKELLYQAIRENVLFTMRDILKISPILEARYKAGMLKIAGAIYDIDSGEVSWLEELKVKERAS